MSQLASARDVAVRVDEAWQNKLASGVDGPIVRAHRPHRLFGMADMTDPISLDEMSELAIGSRPDPSINVPFLIISRGEELVMSRLPLRSIARLGHRRQAREALSSLAHRRPLPEPCRPVLGCENHRGHAVPCTIHSARW